MGHGDPSTRYPSLPTAPAMTEREPTEEGVRLTQTPVSDRAGLGRADFGEK